MFFCGYCNTQNEELQILVNSHEAAQLQKQVVSDVKSQSAYDSSNTTVMVKQSKYKQYLLQCSKSNQCFVDKQFPPNDRSLNYSTQGRQITWKRILDIYKNGVMVENTVSPQNVQQGNLGDCYFLSAISALAQVQTRITNIFHTQFQISGYGIYKLIVNIKGIPTELIIDDHVPVFASTNKPVFCKPHGREIWVMLLEKAWAKIKGSYGEILSGTSHEVLKTFSVAPCFYYQIHQNLLDQQKDDIWNSLVQAYSFGVPVCAGSKSHTSLQGLHPLHTYTILNCLNILTGGIKTRIMKLRNHWGTTQYNGYASASDVKFWEKVSPEVKQLMLPTSTSDDGEFLLPYSQFFNHFDSIDICHARKFFNYSFDKIQIVKKKPKFIKLDILEEHEVYLTVEKSVNKQSPSHENGYSRMIISKEDNQMYEYYCSKLENNLPDLTLRCILKPGRYIVMIEADQLKEVGNSQSIKAIFSNYFENHQHKSKQNIQNIGKFNMKYIEFLETVFKNHALRLNNDPTKLSPKNDWIKSYFNFKQGGFGYILCHIQQNSNVKISIKIDRRIVEQNGFILLTNQKDTFQLQSNSEEIFIFSITFAKQNKQQLRFPPPGFTISKIV